MYNVLHLTGLKVILISYLQNMDLMTNVLQYKITKHNTAFTTIQGALIS